LKLCFHFFPLPIGDPLALIASLNIHMSEFPERPDLLFTNIGIFRKLGNEFGAVMNQHKPVQVLITGLPWIWPNGKAGLPVLHLFR